MSSGEQTAERTRVVEAADEAVEGGKADGRGGGRSVQREEKRRERKGGVCMNFLGMTEWRFRDTTQCTAYNIP